MSAASELMRQYAAAVSTNEEFDGTLWLPGDMDALARFVEEWGNGEPHESVVMRARGSLELCGNGLGHWNYNCTPACRRLER